MEQTARTLASDLLPRLPSMTEEERRLGLEIYRQLSLGKAVPRSTLAKTLEVTAQEVDALLEHPNLRWLTYADTDGRITDFGGLTVREMPHRFTVDGRTLYTWCAWDSLFIPVILGQTAEVESQAPGGSARVRLRVTPGGVTRVEPRSAVMSFLLPTAQTFQGDALKAIATLCHYIFFFAERETALAWTAHHPDTLVISVSDAFELGRRMVAARWHPALART